GDFGHADPLPIDPWVLGALIGRAQPEASAARFATVAEDLLERMRDLVGDPDGYRAGVPREALAPARPSSIPSLQAVFERLDVSGETPSSSVIPRCYLDANRASRLDLLRGLLDID